MVCSIWVRVDYDIDLWNMGGLIQIKIIQAIFEKTHYKHWLLGAGGVADTSRLQPPGEVLPHRLRHPPPGLRGDRAGGSAWHAAPPEKQV